MSPFIFLQHLKHYVNSCDEIEKPGAVALLKYFSFLMHKSTTINSWQENLELRKQIQHQQKEIDMYKQHINDLNNILNIS